MKILTALTIAAIALNVSGALAETCEGGSLQTGENGYVYCLSNKTMNWWSAYTWCQAQGMKLASAYDLCPTWSGALGDNKCDTKISSAHRILWTSTAKENNEAIAYYGNVGDMKNYPRTRGWYAACVAK